MRISLGRAMASLVLLVLGAGLIVVGARYHSQEVLAQIEQKAPKVADLNLPTPTWMSQGPAPVESGPRYVATWIREGEPMLIKEVTIGGLVLAEDGSLKRTYSGDMPSLCPT